MQLSVPLKPENFIGGFDLPRLAELDRSSGAYRLDAAGYKLHKLVVAHTVTGTRDLIRGLAAQFAGVADVAHLIVLAGSPARTHRLISASEPNAAAPVLATVVTRAETAWLTNVNDANASTTAKSLAKTINTLMAVLRAGDVAAINLSLIDRGTPSAEHLVAILRSLYSWRETIPGWRELHDFAKVNLASRNYDAERLLRGLDA